MPDAIAKKDCPHDRVRHGHGSAYYDIQCVNCGARIGSSLTVEAAKKQVDWCMSALKFAKLTVVEAERFEAWQKAHPGVKVEGGASWDR